MFFDEKLSKTTELHYFEPGLYSSITDIVESMNTLAQERNNHTGTWKVNRVTQKTEVYLSNEKSSVAFYSTDLGHISGGDVRND